MGGLKGGGGIATATWLPMLLLLLPGLVYVDSGGDGDGDGERLLSLPDLELTVGGHKGSGSFVAAAWLPMLLLLPLLLPRLVGM